MNLVYLHLGSNIGDRGGFLQRARSYIQDEIGEIINSSKVYETSPWGVDNQEDYLNQALCVQTMFPAKDILSKALYIEKMMGRIRSVKWQAREIDIDILFFNNDIISTKDLEVPHPLLHKRLFVLQPLMDIAPIFIHPIYNQTIAEMLESCSDLEKLEEYAV